MDFIFTDELINSDDKQEIVIIEVKDNIRRILFHFPPHRFSDYNQKLKDFMIKINGYSEGNYIISKSSNYAIYENFYLTFY
jgi:hypothetical protein